MNFKWYLKVVKGKSKRKGQETNLTEEYLEQLWEKQKGKCPYSNLQLELRTHAYAKPLSIYTASLDRIDNKIGYRIGNVKFVSVSFNYARNNFSVEDTITMCKAVAKHNK